MKVNTTNPRLARAQPGEHVAFGRYPQSAAGTDSTPILWRVLHNGGDTLLLLSEYIIDCRRYHHAAVATSWRDCALRAWLNHELFRTAFTAAERARIAATTCTGNGHGSPATADRIFLLSVAEVEEFTSPRDGDMRRRTIGTDYAKVEKADGCRLYVYDKRMGQDYLRENGKRYGCSWWWTRTQSQRQSGKLATATFIGARSNIKRYGAVALRYYGVRPALRITVA